MNRYATLALLPLSLFLMAGSCGKTDTDAGVEGGGSSYSCYIADMFLCYDYPMATPAQLRDAPVVCSSSSGVPSMPAACPTAGYQGKCIEPASSTGMDAVQVRRFYTGADVTYAADFCVNTTHGTWSTTY